MRGARAVVAVIAVAATLGAVPSGRSGCCEATSTYDPAWLPDGHSIVFATRTAGHAEISGMSVDDPSSVRTLAGETPAGDLSVASDPAVSADGQLIAFVSDDSSKSQLALMRADGSGQRLLSEPAAQGQIALSPTGSEIAFVPPSANYNDPKLAVLDVASGVVTSLGRGRLPAWSPDGALVAFIRDGDVWVERPDGTGGRDLSSEPGSESQIAWSPRGDRLAYVNQLRDGRPRVELLDVQPGTPRLLRAGAGLPSFSHDGRLLAVGVDDARSDAAELTTIDLATGAEHGLGVLVAGAIAWSPDDSRLLFVDQNNNGSGLATVSVHGGQARGLYAACLPDNAPRLIGCSTFGGYSVPFAVAKRPLQLGAFNQGAPPTSSVEIEITVHDANGYRVRDARVRLRTVPASAARKPLVGGPTFFDGYLTVAIDLRTRRLADVRFVLSLLAPDGHALIRRVFTCHDLGLPPARGCRR